MVIAYLLVWYTDSIWEYIPASKPNPIISEPGNCRGYYDSMGDYIEPCIPEQQEDPGWQGR